MVLRGKHSNTSLNLGILERFPLEIRLLIYEQHFLSSNARLDVTVEYNFETGQVVTSQITRHGNELLYASMGIWREAFNVYWQHTTIITATRILYLQARVPASSSRNTPAVRPPTDPLPVHLGMLVQVLPKIVKQSTRHLRNVELPMNPAHDTTLTGRYPLTGPRAATLLAQFPNLETVMFNEYRDGVEFNAEWKLSSSDTVMEVNVYTDFLLSPGMDTPQRWLLNRYNLDVSRDPFVSKIHFLKKAVEKRRTYWEFIPGNGLHGVNNPGQARLYPLNHPPPLAVCA